MITKSSLGNEGHSLRITISSGHDVEFEFLCQEPEGAWCRQCGLPDEHACWFTDVAGSCDPWILYDGPQTELRSGSVEFTRRDDHDGESCTWRYAGDPGRAQASMPAASRSLLSHIRFDSA